MKGINIYRRVRRQRVAESRFHTRQERISERNRLMIMRYYYWTEIRRMRFDDVLRILSDKEFFINERTIQTVIAQDNGIYHSLSDGQMKIASVRTEYPNWNWN